MALSKADKQAVAWIEEQYWEYQRVPTIQQLEDRFGYNPLEDEEVKTALHKKYLLPFYEQPQETLTAAQLLALNKVCNPKDRRSFQVKLNECKVTSQQWATWINDPNFMRHFSGRLERNFRDALPEVMMSVVDVALGGDVKAQTLYLTMMGKYSPTLNVNVDVDLNSQIDLLVEILQQELGSQPELLQRIAERFQNELNAAPKKVAAIAGPAALTQGFDY